MAIKIVQSVTTVSSALTKVEGQSESIAAKNHQHCYIPRQHPRKAGGAKTHMSMSVIDSSQIPDRPDPPDVIKWIIFGTPKYQI